MWHDGCIMLADLWVYHVMMLNNQGRFKRDIKAADFWNGHEWFTVTDIVPQR